MKLTYTSCNVFRMTASNEHLLPALAVSAFLSNLHARERHVSPKLVEPAFDLDRVADSGAAHVANVDVRRHARLFTTRLGYNRHAGDEVDDGCGCRAVDPTQRVYVGGFEDQLGCDAPLGGGRGDGDGRDEEGIGLAGGDFLCADV